MNNMLKDFRTDLTGVDELTSEKVSITVGWWLTENEVKHVIDTAIEYQPMMGKVFVDG